MTLYTGTAGPDVIDGSSGDDVINGLGGNDILNGGFGADAMSGGTGDDTYYVDNPFDTVTENHGEGTDIVFSTIDFSLSGQYVENLTMIGSEGRNLTGNGLNNILIGNSAANVINGASGADRMEGGYGDDVYYVDNVADQVVELIDRGNDTVWSSIDYAVGGQYIETVRLSGSANLNATGNGLNNTLFGNAGSNRLNGGAGADFMSGSLGNDSYYVDNTNDLIFENIDQGTDSIFSSVSYAMTANIENLSLSGSGNLTATGNASANTIIGNAGNNLIDGGGGVDTMQGGLGDDTYIIDSATEHVIEGRNQGNDTVIAYWSTSIAGQYIENLTLGGSLNINAIGNSLNNIITGNSNRNVINGGVGADTMTGGAGDDTYWVDNGHDVAVEDAGGGTDTIRSFVDNYRLPDHVENLILADGVINGRGNSLANTITGNASANVLNGYGGGDTLIGGAGDDTYYLISLDDHVVEAAGEGVDTVFSRYSYVLDANVETASLMGDNLSNLNGNGLDNHLYGNSSQNVLDGKAGADTMAGGFGNDTYYVDNAADIIIEEGLDGYDTVHVSADGYILAANVELMFVEGVTSISVTGNAQDNRIFGNDLGNAMDGGAGADYYRGGWGNDTYYMDNALDQAVEAPGGGTDTIVTSVSWVLVSANIENLTLTSSDNLSAEGNRGVNVIIGNAGDNEIIGAEANDILTGGAGADTFAFAIYMAQAGNGNFHAYWDEFGKDVVTDYNPGEGDNLHFDIAAGYSYTISQSGADAVVSISEPASGEAGAVTATVTLQGVDSTSQAFLDSIHFL